MVMQCARCNKQIATNLVECECKRAFHPGCVKPYATTRYADSCCKSLLDILPLTPGVTERASFDIMSSSSVNAQSLSLSRPQGDQTMSTNDLLLVLTEQFRESSARFAAFVEAQQRTNSELNDKLDKLNSIAGSVERNNLRIIELEQRCDALTDEIALLKVQHRSRPVVTGNQLILSGVPAAMPVAPSDCVTKLFKALEIPDLACHILNVRPVVRKPSPIGAGDRRPSPASQTSSLVVTLASGAVCDAVMAKKRARRAVTQREICGNDSSRSVHVNELLPKDVYELLQQTKRVARDRSYAYVWARAARIHVRRSNGEPVIFVDSVADLDKLI